MRQDAIAANLQRIDDLSVDIANHVIKTLKLGLPKSASDSFRLLVEARIISEDLLPALAGMVGFRNVIVHQYAQLDVNRMINVIEHHLEMPIDYAQCVLQALIKR